MEEEQKNTIKNHLPELIENTECTTSVFTQLLAKEMLSPEEVENFGKLNGNYEKGKELYRILQSRQGAYEILVRILRKENQTGAVEILRRHPGTPVYNNGISFSYDKLPELEAFFCTNMIISTLCEELTKEKIENSAKLNSIQLSIPIVQQFGDDESHTYQTIDAKSISRKIIIVHADHINLLKKELHGKDMNYIVINDRFSWNDLSQPRKHSLMNKSIIFQGNEMSLKQLCKKYESMAKKSSDNLLKKLEGSILVELMNQTEPLVISNGNIPSIPKNYVARELKSRSRISRKIINITRGKTEYKDLLLFVGLELYELTGLVQKYGNEKLTRSRDIKSESDPLACQAIHLQGTEAEYVAEFERVCSLTSHPVHILHCIKNPENENEVLQLQWKKSRGSLAVIRKYMHDQQDVLNEEELRAEASESKTMKSFCIAELPGNGKTTLLAKFAQSFVQQKQGNSYTQYVVSTEFVKQLIGEQPLIFADKEAPLQRHDASYVLEECHKLGENVTSLNHDHQVTVSIPTSRVFDALAELSCESSFGRAFVKLFVKSHGVKCDYMFDGLDELTPNHLTLMVAVINYLRMYKKNSLRIWVTTRPDLLQSLEETLGVLGHTIEPFQEEGQIQILTQYWCNEGAENNEKLKQAAVQYLQQLKSDMKDDEGDIAGIPLLCLLIAEVCKNDVLGYCRNDESINNLLPKISISKLYKKFIKKRFKKSNVDRRQLEYTHVKLALKLLLPRTCDSFSKAFGENLLIVSEKEILPLGVVHNALGARFIHKTIAEYFAAKSLFLLFNQIVEYENASKQSHELMNQFFNLCCNILTVSESYVVLSEISNESCGKKSYRFENQNICRFVSLMLGAPLHGSQ